MPNNVSVFSSGEHRKATTLPLNEIPAVVPIRPTPLKARGSAVFIDSLVAYSAGLRLRVECRFREPGLINPDSFIDVVRSRLRGGPHIIAEYLEHSSDKRTDNLYRQSTLAIEGSRTDFSLSMGYWIQAGPHNADLIISFAWPDCGLDGRMLKVSYAVLSKTAQKVTKLWDN
jgi:hypothetical protein